MVKPFQAQDLHLLHKITALDTSPLHDQIVYAVQRTDREADASYSGLWLVDGSGGSPPKQLTVGHTHDTQPQWSSDGRHVAFLSDRVGGIPQVHLIDVDGGEAVSLTEFAAGAQSVYWHPSGSRLLVIAQLHVDPSLRGRRSQGAPPDAAEQERKPEIVWRLPYKSDGIGYTLDREAHLFDVDMSGAIRQLTDGAFDVRTACWSPDGSRIAYARTRDVRLAHRTDIWISQADGRGARQLSSQQACASSPSWSPDGRWVVFIGAQQDGDSQLRLWLANVADCSVQSLGSQDVEVATGEQVRWRADSMGIEVIVAERGCQILKSFTVPGGVATTLLATERHMALMAGTRSHWVYTVETAASARELFSTPRHTGAPEQQLTCLNAWWHERTKLRVELRQFLVPDGEGGIETIDGWLLRCADSSGVAPLLVDVHGGPSSYALLAYESHVYWPVLCSLGWTVLALNPVGSSSYGRRFSERLDGHWGELDLPQHLSAVEQLQAAGLADERVAITGKSYGGYLSAWAIGQTTRFRAAVVSAPIGNLESHFGTSDSGYHADAYSIGGALPTGRASKHRLSPAKHAHKARTPTLLLQGKADERCPLGQAEELFVTLMCCSRAPTEMALYPGSGHHFFESGKPSFREDAAQRLVDWMQEWSDVPVES